LRDIKSELRDKVANCVL